MGVEAVVLADTRGLERDAWLAIRRQGLGGSDAAAVCGLDPWRTPLAVYCDKAGTLPEEPPSEAMAWGTRIEPLVAEAFAERTGFVVRRRNAILQHPEHPWMLANVDRLVTEPGGVRSLLEAKTTGAWGADDWADGPPERVRIQVLHYLAVLGLDHGWAAALIGGQRLVWHRVERDERAVEALIEIERRFWQEHVLARVPPAAGQGDADVLQALYPEATDEVAVLPSEAGALLEACREAGEAVKEATGRKEAARERLCQMLGTAAEGWLAGAKVCTWRTQQRKAHMVAASESRVFRLTKEGK